MIHLSGISFEQLIEKPPSHKPASQYLTATIMPYEDPDILVQDGEPVPSTGSSLIILITSNPYFFTWFLIMVFLSAGKFLASSSIRQNINQAGTVAYSTRARWLPAFYRVTDHLGFYSYMRLPTNFREDVEAGLTSDSFNLAGNIMDGDSRAGLDDESKREVMKIMKRYRVGFDEARVKMIEEQMRKAGIAPDGRPLDPRAVTFASLN